ncbi:SDR family NAD(P)-dependent oxidoreductase [Parabacteroides sp.]
MYNPFTLEGKLIIVTGASSGIGRQCAIDCSKMGAIVVLIARNEERLRETLSLMECPEKHSYYSVDLLQIDQVKSLVDAIVSEHGKIDAYVHAAGIEKTLPLKLLSSDDYKSVFTVNALSAFEFIRYFSNRKYFNDGGRMVLISSILSVVGRGGVSAYAASKGAMVSAVKSMALELAQKKICINCISPGTIRTPLMERFLSSLSEEEYKKRISGFPLGLGEVTDVSQACLFLLSDASRWITGQNIVVDGGYTAQ